jgi:DNA-binding CsgD family transcriptional regulator
MSNKGDKDNSRFTTRNKLDEFYRLHFLRTEKGTWLAEFYKPLPINILPKKQEEHILKYAYLADCNISFLNRFIYDNPNRLSDDQFTQLMNNVIASKLVKLRSFLIDGYWAQNIKTIELDGNGDQKYFFNNVVGVVEDNHLIRVWGVQEDVILQKSDSEPETSLEKQLTPQQMRVLKLTAEGLKVKDIAAELKISPKTVEYLRKRIKDKFAIESLSEMVALAIKFGLEIKNN